MVAFEKQQQQQEEQKEEEQEEGKEGNEGEDKKKKKNNDEVKSKSCTKIVDIHGWIADYPTLTRMDVLSKLFEEKEGYLNSKRILLYSFGGHSFPYTTCLQNGTFF